MKGTRTSNRARTEPRAALSPGKKRMRLNHMEMTFPVGSLTETLRGEIDDFYGSIFGWTAFETEVAGQRCHLLTIELDQFILLAESDNPMHSPGYDHLGLLQDSRHKVDDLLLACERYAEKDDRVKINQNEDLVYPERTVHTFYVKYLLPVYFDVHSFERPRR